MTIYLDFESRGFVDLPKVGVTRYATDRRTQVLCMAWSYDKEERVRLWHRAHPWITKSPRPGNLIERIRSGEPVEAHNAGFEFAIWNIVLRREFPEFDVELQLEQMHCSAAKGSCVSMPRALGDAADAAMLTNRKLKDGKRLIDKLSKPQFPRKKKKDGDWDIDDVVGPLWSWCEDEEDHRANWDYCKQDVRTEREFSEWLPDMTETERKYWLMDQRMNARGITLDADGARLAFRLARQETARLNSELCAITDGEVEKGTNRKALKTWINVHLEQLGAEPIADTKADTLSFALRGAPTKASDEVIERVKPIADKRWSEYGEGAEVVRRAMEISMEVNQTSVAKYTAMLESVSPDGRCHDIMLYNGASKTGRWCISGVAEVLTREGWQKIEDWNGGDIIQWDESGDVFFAPATRVQFPYQGEMVRMCGSRSELLCTPDHRVPSFSQRNHNLSVSFAGDLHATSRSIPLGGVFNGDFESEWITRAIVMFQADGSISNDYRTKGTLPTYKLHFRKPRKIDRCRTILKNSNIRFNERIEGDGTTRFYIANVNAPDWLKQSKIFGSWLFNHDPKVFVDELKHWDGTTDRRNDNPGTDYVTCSFNNAEWVQTLAHLAGTSATIKSRGIRNKNWSEAFRVFVLRQGRAGCESGLATGWTFNRENFDGQVYCAQTISGFFLVRYNNTIQVTGNSGKGIQPQNFVRGYKKEMTQVWDDMISLPPEVTTILWDEPLKMLAKACRGALTASPGCELYAADFNAIEARKLAWLSNCQSQLALFVSGGDPYIDMAQAIYKCELNKKDNPNERNLGKRAILGLGYCFAADTLVLTKRGWIRIDQVRLSDLLWDGCEWVSHKGLVCNGQKFVMSLGETFLTTDHLILCGDKFHPAREVGADVSLYFQALATSAATLPSSGVSWRAISDSRLGQSKIRGGQKENVYDLIDAGPRHRYTVLTRHGPMIVHNSMGWEKFQTTVWREEGIWLEDEFCQMIVDVYRKEKCPEVPKLWKASEAAAIAAVVEGGEHWAGGNDDGAGAVKYFMHKKFLHCQLPSGRYLAYLEPRVRTRVTWRFRATNMRGKPCHVMVSSKTNVATQRVRGEAERLAVIQCKTLTNDPPKNYVAPHLSFMGQNQITKQWTRLGTHGGSLVENYDQASSRDLLAEAMYRVDQDDRFALLLSIHDEVIAEGEKGCCTLEEFEELMAVVPAWAPGMPITAEGWLSGRLRK